MLSVVVLGWLWFWCFLVLLPRCFVWPRCWFLVFWSSCSPALPPIGCSLMPSRSSESLLVLPAGILAAQRGEDFLHPSQAPCICVFAVFGVASIHARLNRQRISCWNSYRAVLSIAMMWVFAGFGLAFLFCFVLWVLWFFVCFSSCGCHRIWTIFGRCMGPCSLLILPKRRRCKMLHNSFNWHKHCVTTWREPRRRRTEKKSLRVFWLYLQRPSCQTLMSGLLIRFVHFFWQQDFGPVWGFALYTMVSFMCL